MKSINSNWVFITLAFALVLIIFKYLSEASPIVPSFIINDLLAILLIVVSIFVTLQLQSVSKSLAINHALQIEKLKADFEISQNKLLETIDASENKSNEEKRGIVIVNSVNYEIKKLAPIKDLTSKANKILSILAAQFDITTGILYQINVASNQFGVMGTYAIEPSSVSPIELGIGLHGQALLGKEVRVVDSIPADYYSVYSGLGEAKSSYLYLLPIFRGDKTIGLVELSSFKKIKIDTLWEELNSVIGNILAKE